MLKSINQPWAISEKYANRYGETWTNLDFIFEDKIIQFNNPDSRFELSEFFEVCNNIRQKLECKESDFIVLLTNKRNSKNWISANDGRNIYINVKDLEHYSYNQTKYPIAYQIIENIFQARCGIVYNNEIIDPRLHKIPEGCINDLCTQKSKIINKLKEAKICRVCKKVAKDYGMETTEIECFDQFLKVVKNNTYARLEQKSIGEKLLRVNEIGLIFINDVEVDIDWLPKSFYLFFLQQEQGAVPYKMKESVKGIAIIYQKLKHKGVLKSKLSKTNIEKIRTKVMSVEGSKNVNFSRIVNVINDSLKAKLDKSLVNLFLLQSNESQLYSVKIDQSMIDIHNNFLLNK